ncbi:hypothetical protein BS78_02G063500 [Paspalum vaginatum]|nr:hypothetical protein BS78_02G063500 [Paspalum vaginatum]
MEEASSVVTMATGAIGPVVAKMSALLGRREYKLRRRTRKDVKLMTSKLKSIHSLLWAIWEREDLDAQSKELRREAWYLADDMDDAIDDFILNMKRGGSDTSRRFVQDKVQQPGRHFEDFRRRADDVSERCRKKWKPLVSRKKDATVDSAGKPRRVHPFVRRAASELVGMDRPKDELVKHLVGGEESTPGVVQTQLKMAAIVGSAGMGKTTLAHLVYEAIENKFQAKAFVSLTESSNMAEVLASILRQVAADDPSIVVPPVGAKPAKTQNRLIDIISNFLEDRRYLVIIDDIWNWGEWETIRRSLPDNNLLGSRIVTTTRVKSITENWEDEFDALVYKIDGLDFSQVTQMIEAMKPDMVGEGFDCKHSIVLMCGGTPLAILCMLSALTKEREHQGHQGLCVETRDVQDRIEKQVRQNGIQNTPGFEPLVESLWLGYNDLPHHMLKTCLLYSSIQPGNYFFRRDDIVRRWIAQGFVCKEETAEDYFDELVSRGLLIVRGGFTSFHEVNPNPMLRNYLGWKLREDNFITCSSGIPSSGIGRRLCVDYWPHSSSDAVRQVDPLSGIEWRRIRSLVVLEGAERVPYKHLDPLRVLDVQRCWALENRHLKDMCGLLRLRHLLGLTGKGITEIPTEIVRLQYLETLELSSTGITRLPGEIGGLKQLKTLELSFNGGLTELPREMENLQDLETLCVGGTNIGDAGWEIITRLKKLKTLDVNYNGVRTGLPRDIGGLLLLKNLNVSYNKGITELPKEIGNLEHLETLNIRATGITKLPRDIGKLQKLETLDLVFTKVRKVPREMGALKKLKNFHAFIAELPFEAAQISRLKGLPRWAHQAWKNSDLMSSLAGEILSFQQTTQIRNGGLIIGTKHMRVPRWIHPHFNDVGSLDIRICKIEEQDLKILREMPSLEGLALRFEAVPREPIAISGEGFAKLKGLVVDSRVPRVTFQEGAMPSLGWLEFVFQFYGGPPDIDPVGIKHLVSLQHVMFRCNEWYRGESPCISATIDAVRDEAREHRNAKTFDGITFLVSTEGRYGVPEHFAQDSQDTSNVVAGSSGVDQIEEVQA